MLRDLVIVVLIHLIVNGAKLIISIIFSLFVQKDLSESLISIKTFTRIVNLFKINPIFMSRIMNLSYILPFITPEKQVFFSTSFELKKK